MFIYSIHTFVYPIDTSRSTNYDPALVVPGTTKRMASKRQFILRLVKETDVNIGNYKTKLRETKYLVL